MWVFKLIDDFFVRLLNTCLDAASKVPTPRTVPLPVPQKPEPIPEPPKPKYLWDTKEHIRHTIRVLCDEAKMTLEQKNTMTATIAAESGFKLDAVNYNKKNGKIVSTDHSLIQVNDFYHIGPGKSFPSVEFVYANPEAQVRWMCKQWKAGNRNWWIAYKNKSYLKYL